jgi:peptidoglycan/LPS O-acetylase OafA/YrhL
MTRDGSSTDASDPTGIAGNAAGALAYRPDIDGLRAIAVLCVVAFHAFPRLLPGGFVGVDIFFVISGYLISGLIFSDLQRSRFRFRRFYARRFRRIFPALLVVLGACLLYGWFALAPDEYRELGRQVAAGAGFGANLLFWRESGYFDAQASAKPLLHLWSLGVEEQFYLTWPILIVLAFRRGRLLAWMAAIGLAASLLCSVLLTLRSASAAFYLPVGRYWELLAGALLAYCFTGRAQRSGPLTGRRAELLAALGVSLIVLALLLINSSRAFPGGWVVLPVGGTLLLIASSESWLNRRVLSTRVMVFIGLISYPLYLWHWVLLSFARIGNLGEEIPRSWRMGAVAAAFLLAWLTYRLVEHPIRFSSRRAMMPYALVATMMLCALLGAVVYLSRGADFRYPPQLRGLAAEDYDADKSYYEDIGGRCFLGLGDSYARMLPQCVDPPNGTAPLVALWGDSHAASLYPGLRASQGTQAFRLAQLTASACPPLLGAAPPQRSQCVAFNDAVLAALSTLRPQVVVLEAHWARYMSGADAVPLQAIALRRTIRQLQAIGVNRVVVMGSLPSWRINQPRVTFEIWRRWHVVVDRSTLYLDPNAFAADRAVQGQVAGSGAVFVSPVDSLCDSHGCLLSADAHVPVPMAWDNDHLSVAGATLLISRTLPEILGIPRHDWPSIQSHLAAAADPP